MLDDLDIVCMVLDRHDLGKRIEQMFLQRQYITTKTGGLLVIYPEGFHEAGILYHELGEEIAKRVTVFSSR